MRGIVVTLALSLVLGCGPSAPETNNSPAANTASAPPADTDYGRKILAELDKFDKVADNAQRLDFDSIKSFEKTGKFPKEVLDRLSKAVTSEMDVMKEMRDLKPPKQFEEFHKQVLQNTNGKIDVLAGLTLALEKNDKKEIAKVLDTLDFKAKLAKQEMDKILQGKTAEQFLGLK
ncbi:MAG: hypothetical protein JST12_17640 [Armatimonadetes bacterium]|nr:hypothetical protein [Armatimonadota bacterium]